MKRLQLATLLDWAGEPGLQGRKRLQKVVYLLQRAGCPFDCQYVLHHYGPYSRDVADVCDEMVAADLVEEQRDLTSVGAQYTYRLPACTQGLLSSARGEDALAQFKTLAEELIAKDIWQLELGATVALFYEREEDWDAALQKACEFKSVGAGDLASEEALELAKKVVSRALS
ncbi:hypothetical protein MalM25_37690 [Planctomycetes bacterium MalM25]|nr:hypothetical protein MalM25_37690 [Planctomycetes bacterium MalM25]